MARHNPTPSFRIRQSSRPNSYPASVRSASPPPPHLPLPTSAQKAPPGRTVSHLIAPLTATHKPRPGGRLGGDLLFLFHAWVQGWSPSHPTPPHPGNTQPSLSEYAPPDPLIYTAGSKGGGTDVMIFLSQGIRIFHTPSPLPASQPQPALPRHTPYRTPAGPTDCHLSHTTNPKPAPSGLHTASTRAHHPRAAMVVGPTTTPGSQPSPTGNPTDSTKAQGIYTVSLAERV